MLYGLAASIWRIAFIYIIFFYVSFFHFFFCSCHVVVQLSLFNLNNTLTYTLFTSHLLFFFNFKQCVADSIQFIWFYVQTSCTYKSHVVFLLDEAKENAEIDTDGMAPAMNLEACVRLKRIWIIIIRKTMMTNENSNYKT